MSQVRLVRCPKCRQLLAELPETPVNKCGGCGVTLPAESRIYGLRSMSASESGSSGCNAALPESGECFSDEENERDQTMSSEGNESSESGDCFSDQENERDQIMSSEDDESFT